MLYICPDCRAKSESGGPAGRCTLACSACYAKRQVKLRELEARNVDTHEAVTDGYGRDLPLRLIRDGSGRRIIRKPEPMGG